MRGEGNCLLGSPDPVGREPVLWINSHFLGSNATGESRDSQWEKGRVSRLACALKLLRCVSRARYMFTVPELGSSSLP